MRYFLTGITGFACPHLARLLLQEGHEVHALVRGSNGCELDLLDLLTPEELETITFHYGDLKDYQGLVRIFNTHQFDGVFHLGAQSHPPTSFLDPVATMETNVMGTVYLIEVITRYQPDCVFQFTSSSEVYGDSCKNVNILTEHKPLVPSNPYGTSKAMIDLYVQERCNNGFLKGFITRAFSHTGARRGKKFSISWDAYHLALMKNGITDSKILPVGNLETQRIVIDVKDCMRAYYELMQKFHFYEKGKLNFDGDIEKVKRGIDKLNPINGQAYNVCGDITSVKKMEYFTDKLIEISGIKGVTKKIDERVYRPIDIQIQVGDTTKIKNEINWQPTIPIDKTLENLFIYWIKKTDE